MGRLFAIGDIHGDLSGFMSVLNNMFEDGMDLKEDTLVFIGDYIDGGENSAAVVETIRELEFDNVGHVIPLIGNHEDMFIHAITNTPRIYRYENPYDLWYTQGGAATLESYKRDYGNMISPEEDHREAMQSDAEWMRNLKVEHSTSHFHFVHAGLTPFLPPEATADFNKLWIRDVFLDSTYDWGKIVVHGHTPHEHPEYRKNRINIDTMRHGNGRVCGTELIDRKHFTIYLSSNQRRSVQNEGVRFRESNFTRP